MRGLDLGYLKRQSSYDDVAWRIGPMYRVALVVQRPQKRSGRSLCFRIECIVDCVYASFFGPAFPACSTMKVESSGLRIPPHVGRKTKAVTLAEPQQ